MACFKPLKGWRSDFPNKNGKYPVVFKPGPSATRRVDLPCGQCIGCRLDRSRMWAARCVHEAQMHDESCFLTLTYTPETLPHNGSLVKAHFQKFIKRLRYHYPDKNIRYYMCGEYGEQLQRPHYHALIFGMDFEDITWWATTEQGDHIYHSEIADTLWRKGLVWIGEVTFESAAYVARYCLKKVTGKDKDDHYMRCDDYGVAYWLQEEYTAMSKGIGRDWYDRYRGDCFPRDQLPVAGRGIIGRPPRYYFDIYEIECPGEAEKVRASRQKYFWEHFAEGDTDRLESRERVKKAQLKMLKRSLEDE